MERSTQLDHPGTVLILDEKDQKAQIEPLYARLRESAGDSLNALLRLVECRRYGLLGGRLQRIGVQPLRSAGHAAPVRPHVVEVFLNGDCLVPEERVADLADHAGPAGPDNVAHLRV